jgi:hypothetical protein
MDKWPAELQPLHITHDMLNERKDENEFYVQCE